MTNNSNNWSTDLEKAKAVINSDLSLVEISQLTGIDIASLSGYDADQKSLNCASWTTINKLAQLWQVSQITATQVNTPAFFYFVSMLSDWFESVKRNNTDGPLKDVLDSLSKMVMSNPAVMYELFKVFDENGLRKNSNLKGAAKDNQSYRVFKKKLDNSFQASLESLPAAQTNQNGVPKDWQMVKVFERIYSNIIQDPTEISNLKKIYEEY
ncbi:hypothetical protein [Lentilactobacillus diolivorans]|uniref:Uncharacterized protein n=2 Tax=Lentilactobacillus diolivorans TaxID=179838 RepID=A0A0R1SIR5_9LACO|nr:hypothetical protein [Lentilactobacillus diolivorans]KRL69056.1 hypothetical protein FC85_GL002275 [Lentilactobacillus diolivorans DSM 14421]GEP22496.1 hypothetical protein LDI01_00890 [Lentilactobacillus diolivorans]